MEIFPATLEFPPVCLSNNSRHRRNSYHFQPSSVINSRYVLKISLITFAPGILKFQIYVIRSLTFNSPIILM